MKKTSKEIIEHIESDASNENAFFIFNIGEENQDNEHIETNRDGLKVFAAFLLRIAYGYQVNNIPQKQENVFPIDKSLSLLGRGWLVNYIKLIDVERSELESKRTKQKRSIKNKLFEFGCFGVLIFLVISCIVGLYSIVIWIV